MNTNTTRRHRLQKPVRPTDRVKEATSAEALALLNEIVNEARKEIRKCEHTTIAGRVSKTDCDHVTFMSKNFSLTLNFKEGLAV